MRVEIIIALSGAGNVSRRTCNRAHVVINWSTLLISLSACVVNFSPLEMNKTLRHAGKSRKLKF